MATTTVHITIRSSVIHFELHVRVSSFQLQNSKQEANEEPGNDIDSFGPTSRWK